MLLHSMYNYNPLPFDKIMCNLYFLKGISFSAILCYLLLILKDVLDNVIQDIISWIFS